MTQQGFARTHAALFRADVEVFKVQPVFAQPGRVIEKVHGIANRLAFVLADQRVGAAVGAE